MRWTLIVRAEVGPHRRCLILLRAHAYSARPLIPARPAAGWLSVCPLTLVTFRDVRGVFAMATITRTAALDEAHVGDIRGALGTISADDFAPRVGLSAKLKKIGRAHV